MHVHTPTHARILTGADQRRIMNEGIDENGKVLSDKSKKKEKKTGVKLWIWSAEEHARQHPAVAVSTPWPAVSWGMVHRFHLLMFLQECSRLLAMVYSTKMIWIINCIHFFCDQLLSSRLLRSNCIVSVQYYWMTSKKKSILLDFTVDDATQGGRSSKSTEAKHTCLNLGENLWIFVVLTKNVLSLAWT